MLEALTKGKLIIYQRDYARSFVHVRDIADALELALSVPIEKIRGQVYNVGSDSNNYTKDEIVALVQQYVDGTTIEHKDLTFGGDMRDLRVSFAKIRRVLGYEPRISVVDGILRGSGRANQRCHPLSDGRSVPECPIDQPII